MNKHLQQLLQIIQQDDSLTADQKKAALKALKDADKELKVTAFKLERTEKVKQTTAVLLEETIAELEQKRKAVEAQNRELEIEAALEKVRSQSLAMDRSDELQEVINTVHNRMIELGVKMDSANFTIFNDGTRDTDLWTATTDNMYSHRTHLPYFDFKPAKDLMDARDQGITSLEVACTFDEKNRWFRYAFEHSYFENMPPARKKYILESTCWTTSWAVARHCAIQMNSYSRESFSVEEREILKRFTKVFEQAYTRFLDLQKAEAQAREAQIENALEKVRSRSLAMHKSDELQDVINTVFERLKDLAIETGTASIIIHGEGSVEMDQWIQNHQHTFSSRVRIPFYEQSRMARDILDSVSSKRDLLSSRYSKAEKNEWFAYMFEHSDLKHLSDVRKQYVLDAPSYNFSIATIKNGAVVIARYSDQGLSDQENDVLKRFARVFEQAYTRFLDLQKAEAQARESQIQLALERVRAKTMAMQSSNDLLSVANALREQMGHLGQPELESSIVHLYDDDSPTLEAWYAYRPPNDPSGEIIKGVAFVPKDCSVWSREVMSKYTSTETEYTIIASGEKIIEWYRMLQKYVTVVVDYDAGGQLVVPEILHYHFSKFSGGALLMISNQEPSAEARELQRRAAKVFEQAYIRFRDLQKAEAQAREAQIEAALERVRSRSMAMYQSSDLKEVIKVVTDQLSGLGLKFESANFNRVNPDGSWDMWLSTPGQTYPVMIVVPYMDHPMFNNANNALQAGFDFLADTMRFEEKNAFFKHFFKDTFAEKIPAERKEYIFNCPALDRSVFLSKSINLAISNYSGIPYTKDENAIIIRFGRVFEQTYTRFLDLQKAEAQAREAQIEASLERVRARTMAMHNSEDVVEATAVLFNELHKLGIETLRCGVLIFHESQTMEAWSATTAKDGQPAKIMGTVDMTIHPLLSGLFQAWRRKEDIFEYPLVGQDKHDYYQAISASPNFQLPPQGTDIPDQISSIFLFAEGGLYTFALQPFSVETKAVLKRFTSVFELTFRRYQDLKKAEAQAREALIEAALERVRSRSMGMQKSEELNEVIKIVYQQLGHLKINLDHAGFVVDYTLRGDWTFWIADEQDIPSKITHPYFESVWANQFNAAKVKGTDFFATYLNFEEKNKFYYELLSYVPGLPESSKDFYLNCPALAASTVLLENVGLYIENFSGVPYTDEENNTLMRFGKVFQQTYTRFLDLQKAEAQAREAQIEAALEKVRSTSLVIHQSQELEKVVVVLFEKLKELEVPFDTTFIYFFDKPQKNIEAWVATKQLANPLKVYMPYEEAMANNPIIADLWYAFENGEDGLNKCYKGKEKDDYYRYEAKHNKSVIPEDITNFCIQAESWTTSFATEENSIMGFDSWSGQQIKEDEFKILKRFAKVFEQAYVRFLDLQKSEAQARESQIQLALERVRAKTMAMQHSGELREIAAAVHDQLLGLGFTSGFCSIVIMDRITGDMTWWMFFPGKEYPESYHMPFCEHPFYLAQLNNWKQGEKYSVIEVSGEEKKSYDKYTFSQTEFVKIPIETQQFMMSFEKIIFSNAYMKHGAFSWGVEPIDDEHAAVLQRFANVFEQCYTRFLDLQKAEAQAREATIQASLERVRAKAMAMHTSSDLTTTAGVVFTEMKRLGINSFRGGVGLIEDRESRSAKVYSAISSDEGDTLSIPGIITVHGHPVLSRMWDSMMDQSDYFPVLKGEVLESYYAQISYVFNTPLTRSNYPEEYGCFLTFSGGLFYVWSEKPYTEPEIKILQRFKAIVDLTFRRYFELQKAETNALDAVRSASLDRVRAEIASMRTKNDLDRITPLIWKELTILGIPFVRCGVFIVDEKEELIHTFLSTPDGKAIAAFHLPFTTANFVEAIQHWRDKKIYVDHWELPQFSTLADTLVEQKAIATREQYLNTVPQQGIYLHYLPFLQGMLYVGNTTALHDDDLKLVQAVADTFSTAYARYEDFNKLEVAKQQVEKTLTDLKSAQALLVQSEKMASLGELTAGIAHEIQNPLNFVNNFSEVSNELIQELKAEMLKATRDEKLEEEILGDISQNLQKINHHGKRAGSIVSGMLQHSRTSTGKREPTNINTLADEYLRLAFHGLRAKDKTFNAKFETVFDENIGKVNVIQQDIGRVILNLITNAFYAVNERTKLNQPGYEPTVTVTTKGTPSSGEGRGGVEVRVKDNGTGIPQKVIDKIFQPFFTTKPTGQGTGLGLSLSYDIVKAHGGVLRVETKEGEGSEFVVVLPIV